jgi:hypothetical protein
VEKSEEQNQIGFEMDEFQDPENHRYLITKLGFVRKADQSFFWSTEDFTRENNPFFSQQAIRVAIGDTQL